MSKMQAANPLAILLSQQKVKPASQKCSCANCQNRPNVNENYRWVSTINENYQREVLDKVEEEKSIALTKRRAMMMMKKAAKDNIPTCTSSSGNQTIPPKVRCRSITNTATNITTTATSITTMTSSIRTPTITICNPGTTTARPTVPSSTKMSERGLGSLPTANSTTTISTRSGSSTCSTTTSNSTTTSTSITTTGPAVQWQMANCSYSVLTYLDRMIITSTNNPTNPRFQSGPLCGNDARQQYEEPHGKKA